MGRRATGIVLMYYIRIVHVSAALNVYRMGRTNGHTPHTRPPQHRRIIYIIILYTQQYDMRA